MNTRIVLTLIFAIAFGALFYFIDITLLATGVRVIEAAPIEEIEKDTCHKLLDICVTQCSECFKKLESCCMGANNVYSNK